jgi:protein SDA1
MLFGMVERGMDAEFVGDKGNLRGQQGPTSSASGGEALWAVTLAKELWKKGIW